MTRATREITPSQGRCWHLQHHCRYPHCTGFIVPPRRLPTQSLPSSPVLALGPTATR